MKTANVSSASALAKIENSLKEDVAIMRKQLANIEDASLKGLIQSLISTKTDIVHNIPTNYNGINQIPVSGTNNDIDVFPSKELQNESTFAFIKALHRYEETTMTFLRYAQDTDGTPEGVERIIEEIADKYNQIIDQLDRMVKTTNISALSIQ